MNTLDTREVLRPYKQNRLKFEGVLIHVIEPTSRNGHMYGLIFASVYAIHEHFELDHVVIKVDRGAFNRMRLKLFKRYVFTAKIDSYFKIQRILGARVSTECFMLTELNEQKTKSVHHSHIESLSLYVRNSIRDFFDNEDIKARYTEEQLLDHARSLPNDGSMERFVASVKESIRECTLSHFDIIQSLYSTG